MRISGGEQHFQPGPKLLGCTGQLAAGHTLWHDDVGEQQVKRITLPKDLQRSRPVLCLTHLIAK
jgi:hypothetical protein